jgi:glutamate dehydrogenase (NADP+)
MNPYVKEVLEKVTKKNPWEKEFIQSVTEVFNSISLVIERDPIYREFRILERLVEPERSITFRVPWRDASGQIHVNTGYRVNFNSALGPYKGGLRFHASVNLSILKFLGFEQIFKNALTGLAMGGGKGGSDFSPRGRSDIEIENFCQSFMTELERHIGINTDVPAGDIGVGAREIGYMFGQYKRLRNAFEGVLTGKGRNWGGSLMRPEATGFGLVYFAQEMLKTKNQSFEGKSVAVSGFGNVAWGAVRKVTELGGRVVTLSGPDGFIHDPDGVTGEKIEYMLRMRLSSRDRVQDYADKFGVKFYAGQRPWGTKVDIALPCACENELDENDAMRLIDNGVMCVAEGANLPTTLKAMEVFRHKGILFSPGKASNAGGVGCSGLEMSQNSMRTTWTEEEVDQKLRGIMKRIHDDTSTAAAEYGCPGDYVMGANIVGFKRVAEAMIDQGNC